MTIPEIRSARIKTAGGGYRWYLPQSAWSSYRRYYHGSMQYSLWRGDSIHPTTNQLKYGSVWHFKTLKECENCIERIENAQTGE